MAQHAKIPRPKYAVILLLTAVCLAAASNGLGPSVAAHQDDGPSNEPLGAEAVGRLLHDVALTNCASEGPAPVHLSDTGGVAMFVTCKAVNVSDHDDTVLLTAPDDLLTSPLPEGCVAAASLVIPGRADFVLLAGEEKELLYRIRFECHAPAVESIVPVRVEVGIEHVAQADGLGDSDSGNNAQTVIDNLIIAAAAGATPTPTPMPSADSDGDGYTDGAEALIGTRADKACGSDGWPADVVSLGSSFNRLDVQDMASFIVPVRRLNSSPGDPYFDPRWDLVPGATGGEAIGVQDMAAMSPSSGSATAYPPMFGGAQAFGQTCPSAP